MDPSEVPKDSIAFEVADWILRSWRFKWLEVFKGAFCCCEYFLFFSFLLEFIFDAKASDFNFFRGF
jgi:hypothetical protein